MLSIHFSAFSENMPTQVIRGTVIDKIIGSPLPGANIILIDSTQLIGVSADENGKFRLENVPVGRQTLKITYIGYKDIIMPVLVYSAKELILTIEMEEIALKQSEVLITANKDNFGTNNKMAVASVRKFNTEEAFRYAGSLSDPARMAMNFAGVTGASELTNDLVIRGNSSSGLLWLLDDVEVPNPNHFAAQGTTGGPISMLSNNVLQNSDFMTAAFPAEYSQALSGVFDLKLRSGNNEKQEFMFQAGVLGLEFGAEGPLTKKHSSSYIINYRYSTMDIIEKMVDLKIAGIPRYQDVTFKLLFPLKKVTLSMFGIGGMGSMSLLDSDENDDDFTASPRRENYYFGSQMAASGISMNWISKHKINHKLTLSIYHQQMKNSIDTLDSNDSPFEEFHDLSQDNRLTLKYRLNKKFSSKLSCKSGASLQKMFFALDAREFIPDTKQYRIFVSDSLSLVDGPLLGTLYSQWLYKLNEKFSMRAGFDVIYFDLNSNFSVEPRLGISYDISSLSSLYLAYGLHSKTPPLPTLYAKTSTTNNEQITTNTSLDFIKSHHMVLGFSQQINEQVKLKIETYGQYLFDIPVESHPSSFSLININNIGSGFNDLISDSLVNTGTGYNYGLEITLEKYFSKSFYYLLTVSLFQSRYTASDLVERNTEFNNNYIINVLGGKEFKLNDKGVLFFNLKAVVAGGKRFTPIDLELSKLAGHTIRINSMAYSRQFKPYYKFDAKAGCRIESKNVSHEISVTVDNFTNHKNVFRNEYDAAKDAVIYQYQLGIIPGFYYRMYF
ncbi:carboxypeptidase-like regulatory domain-containing protein [Bacteroidota bacterium]